MKRFVNAVKKKTISDYFLFGGLIFSIISLIMYLNTGVTEFNRYLELKVIVPLIIVIVLNCLLCLIGSKMGKYTSFVLMIYAFVEYIRTQINYITNVFVGIDGNTFTPEFIITLCSIVLCIASLLVSGILSIDEEELFIKENK